MREAPAAIPSTHRPIILNTSPPPSAALSDRSALQNGEMFTVRNITNDRQPMMDKTTMIRVVLCVAVTMIVAGAIQAKPTTPEPVPLTPAGEKLLSEYSEMMRMLRAEISKALPRLDPVLEAAFLDAHIGEGPKFHKQQAGSKKKPQQRRDSGVYKDFKRQKVTISKARPVLAKLDSFLGSEAVDIPLPYTIGMWQESKLVKLSLVRGKNTLSFTRSVPEEFGKLVWSRSGPEFGGVTIRSFHAATRLKSCWQLFPESFKSTN